MTVQNNSRYNIVRVDQFQVYLEMNLTEKNKIVKEVNTKIESGKECFY